MLASCFIEHASWEGGLNILLSPRSRELSGLPAAMGMGNALLSLPLPPLPLVQASLFFFFFFFSLEESERCAW